MKKVVESRGQTMLGRGAIGPAVAAVERRRLLVQGIVQGVGFRPFVYGLALRLGVAGFVRNDSVGVTVEVEGPPASIATFQQLLVSAAPPLARIDALTSESLPPRDETGFSIEPSEIRSARRTLISPDVATCDDCLRELFDPLDRRFRYPFINCTNCGPRFTIVRDVPYDRDKTTMAAFPLCPACRMEYENPLDRRFHAQPNACPACGPRLSFLLEDSNGAEHKHEAIQEAARRLARGDILAIKGLGGYHLACDAMDGAAVTRLRRCKQRDAKPFAVMALDLRTVRRVCNVSDAEAELLQSHQRPIVVLDRAEADQLAEAVAPGHRTLGVMLPYTPLHHLLLHAFAETRSRGEPPLLVMTSGNLSDEPIVYRDDDVAARLGTVADGVLAHDREIQTRCDDSVTRVVGGGEGLPPAITLVRRSRGYAPEPIPVERPFPLPLLACGGHLKNTFCLGKGRQAFVSQHIGDLQNLETLTAFREAIGHFSRLFDIQPQVIAHDLHPNYLATQYALDADVEYKIGVQHHHAHIASVLAEHRLTGPVIGVAADGTGLGTDGAIWGGEVLVADLLGFERVAHLAYVPLPGGEQAIRQPWRMAAVYLERAFGDSFLDLDIPFVRNQPRGASLHERWRPLAQMAGRGFNSPPTSSLGRLFDAVAALLGLREEVSYEGQAAIELEALATVDDDPSGRTYPFVYDSDRQTTLDVTPLIQAMVEEIQQGVPPSRIARRFHRSIALLLASICAQARDQAGVNEVALSGGVFQNRVLLEDLRARLHSLGFQVYLNRLVPPNDGGLSLGQAAVAAEHIRNKE